MVEFPPRGCRALLCWVYVHTCICYFSALTTSYDLYLSKRMHSRLALAVVRSHKLYGVAPVYSRKYGKLAHSDLPPFRRTTRLKPLSHLPMEPAGLDPTFAATHWPCLHGCDRNAGKRDVAEATATRYRLHESVSKPLRWWRSMRRNGKLLVARLVAIRCWHPLPPSYCPSLSARKMRRHMIIRTGGPFGNGGW